MGLKNNSELKKLSKRQKVWMIVILLILCFVALFFKIAFISSQTVCGKITGFSETVRGSKLIEYSFEMKEGVYHGDIPLLDLKPGLSTDSLIEIECVEIEYSFISKRIHRFSDSRYLRH